MKRRDFLKFLPLAAAAPAVAKGLIENLPEKAETKILTPNQVRAAEPVLPQMPGNPILAKLTINRPLWGGKEQFRDCVMNLIRAEQKQLYSLTVSTNITGVVLNPIRIPASRMAEMVQAFNDRSIFMLTPEVRTYVTRYEIYPVNGNDPWVKCDLIMTGEPVLVSVRYRSEDMEYLENMRFQKEEIAHIFRVPPHLIDV